MTLNNFGQNMALGEQTYDPITHTLRKHMIGKSFSLVVIKAYILSGNKATSKI